MAEQEKPKSPVAKLQQDVEVKLSSLISAGVVFPKDYAVENQVKLAWLKLADVTDKNGRKALEICSPKSIAASVLQMCIEGLSVVKKQCDFIVYGTELQYIREYHGTIALAKRYGGVVDQAAQIIYEGDIIEYKVLPNGRKEIVKHEQKIDNINPDKIKGAYAILTLEDGSFSTELMTMQQIKTAWNQGPMKGNSPAHRNFPDQMCAKTVIGRACKLFISTSDDAGLLNNVRDNDNATDTTEGEKTAAISENSNKKMIAIETSFEEVPPQPEPTTNEPVVQAPF